MTRLFEIVAKPLATILTPDAFLGELRIMAMDGTVMDVPDTEKKTPEYLAILVLPKGHIRLFPKLD